MSSPERPSAERPFDRIVLVGFMGAGKTAVGLELARLLGWAFLDMDGRIEERTGLSIARLFQDRGEAAFREEERRVALEVSRLRRHVVAAGGGAFAEPETREALRKGAVTVWLRCDPETILARVPLDGSRPLARNRAIMLALLAQREPSYRLADATVDSSGGSPAEVARRVAEAVSGRGRRGSSVMPDR